MVQVSSLGSLTGVIGDSDSALEEHQVCTDAADPFQRRMKYPLGSSKSPSPFKNLASLHLIHVLYCHTSIYLKILHIYVSISIHSFYVTYIYSPMELSIITPGFLKEVGSATIMKLNSGDLGQTLLHILVFISVV